MHELLPNSQSKFASGNVIKEPVSRRWIFSASLIEDLNLSFTFSLPGVFLLHFSTSLPPLHTFHRSHFYSLDTLDIKHGSNPPYHCFCCSQHSASRHCSTHHLSCSRGADTQLTHRAYWPLSLYLIFASSSNASNVAEHHRGKLGLTGKVRIPTRRIHPHTPTTNVAPYSKFPRRLQ